MLRRFIFSIAIIFNAFPVFSQVSRMETFYDNKNLILKEVYYVQKKDPSVLDSLYISYYQNGKIKSRGMYSKSKATGIWEYFYENGNLKMRGPMKDNAASGYWEYFYENGKKNMEGEIQKGLREGAWIYYFENGLVKNSGSYKKDKKEGAWKYFYEDASLKANAFFEDDKGKYMEFYTSGKVKSQGEIISGKSNGLWKYFYEDGTLKAEGYEKNGLKEGMWKFYHPNGTLASEGVYEKGMAEGKWKHYHDNGVLSAEGEEKEGKKQGYWKLYYKSGNFKAEGNFVQGDGPYKEYYESGKLKIEGTVKNDKNDGAWKYYYENGTPEGTCHFNMGKGYYTGYYENGTLRMEGMIEDGNKTGIWKLYNADGKLGGYYKTYYENDQVVFKEIIAEKDSVRTDSLGPYIKPKIKIPKKKSRYFTAKVNEFHGFIVASNPLAIIGSRIPVSLEYYHQERLGYEANFTLIRQPFFRSDRSILINDLYKRGYSAYIRQKFYQHDQDNGMFYFAHELRYTFLDHSIKIIDSAVSWVNPLQLRQKETRLEYSVLIGDRLLKASNRSGWTLDVFAGFGVGYRRMGRNWQGENKDYDRYFSSLRRASITFPIRFGFNAGYMFQTKKKQ